MGERFQVNWIEIHSNAETREQLMEDLTAGPPDEDDRRYPFLEGGLEVAVKCWGRVVRAEVDSVAWEPFARATF